MNNNRVIRGTNAAEAREARKYADLGLPYAPPQPLRGSTSEQARAARAVMEASND